MRRGGSTALISRTAVIGLCLSVLLMSSQGGQRAGAAASPLRAVVFGDFNGPYGSTTYGAPVARVITRITDVWRPDIVLSAGDMVAGQKADLPDVRFAEMWQAFDAAVARPLRTAGIPYGFTLGNHDASAAKDAQGAFAFQRERDAAAAYWQAPVHRPRLDYIDGRHFPFFYSFALGGIVFTIVDASTHVIQEPQWVLAALGGARARAAGMRIVLGHLPLYGISEGRSKSGEVIEQGGLWRETFEAHRVDLYISGHHAAYYPAHQGRLRLLHSGGGAGARKYVGHPEIPARSTVTLMQIDPHTRGVTLETYDAETGRPVEMHGLPACIDGYNGPVYRMDLPQRDGCPRRG